MGQTCPREDTASRLMLSSFGDLFMFLREGKVLLRFVSWDFSFEGSGKQWEHLLPPESEEA